jgi:trypsin-like peptidase
MPEPTATPQATPAPMPQEDAIALVKQYTVLVVTDQGFGSGISLGGGQVLTAYHVIENAARVQVRFATGRQEPVRVVGGDSRRDLALLRSSFTEEPTAPMGDAAALRQGAVLLAVGYPRPTAIGIEEVTVTRGIVSARRQSPEGVWLVQTDTSFNPGNSGGPLADGQGRVVGVVTSGVRGAVGLNFAVASDEVKAFLAGPMQPPVARPPVPPAPAPPSVPKAAGDLEAIVRSFYLAISERRNADAYANLSRGAQARESYPAFVRRFEEANNTLQVRFIRGVTREPPRAALSAHTLATHRVSGKQECSRVDWRFVLEDGQWKRDAASQFNEPC